ncbi:MAG: hypothetical protein ACERKO_07010 [Acetanaerobacterium sp.]
MKHNTIRPLLRSFAMFIRQILSDNMLWAVCVAPLLTACMFRFGVVYLERVLCEYYQVQAVLSPYYLLFDLFVCVITSYMFCFASAMVMLEEYDDNMISCLAVTPVGKRGYILSRLALPAVISFFASIVLMLVFSLTVWPILLLLVMCALCAALSVCVSMLVFSFSHNRVEGMAMAKLTGIFLIGFYVPFFLPSGVQYLFAPLPSFWLAKLVAGNNYIFLPPAIACLICWIWLLYKRFNKKIM